MSQRASFLSRRNFLKGLSIAPLAFSPLVTAQRAMAAPGDDKKRLLLVCIQHGPGGYGMVEAGATETKFQMKPWLSPLNDIKQHVTLIDGLLGTWWGDAHKVSYSHLFSGNVKPGTANFSAPRNATLDVIAQQAFGASPIGPLRIQVAGSARTSGTVSFDAKGNPLTMHDVFGANQILLNNLAGIKPNGARLRSKSLLDSAAKDLKALSGRINGKERNKLQTQLQEIQQVTANLGLGQQVQTGGNCQKPKAIQKGARLSQEQEFDLALEHIRLSFTCGLSRVAVLHSSPIRNGFTWEDANNRTQSKYPSSCGTKSGFHNCIAHYGRDKDRRKAYEGAVKYYIQKFADFAKKLDAIKESNGKTMLENTVILITSEVGDGGHDRYHKPNILIGGRGAPGLRTGRYIKPQSVKQQFLNGGADGKINLGLKPHSSRTEADVLRELAAAMGAPQKTFGAPYLNMGKIGLA